MALHQRGNNKSFRPPSLAGHTQTLQEEGVCWMQKVLCFPREGTPKSGFGTNHFVQCLRRATGRRGPPQETAEGVRVLPSPPPPCRVQCQFSRASYPKRTEGQTPLVAILIYCRGSQSVVYFERVLQRAPRTLRPFQGDREVKTILIIILRHDLPFAMC